jgi:hypothetical protein
MSLEKAPAHFLDDDDDDDDDDAAPIGSLVAAMSGR